MRLGVLGLTIGFVGCFEPEATGSDSGTSTGAAVTTSGVITTTGDPASSTTAASTSGGSSGDSSGGPPPSAPDLAVRVLAAAFVPTGLELTYEVSNLGTEASGVYRVDLWDTRSGGFDNPPSLGAVGTFTLSEQPSLASGATDRFTDTVPNPANGTHVAFVVADTMDELQEVDENNNVSLGFPWSNAGGTVHTAFPFTDDAVEIVPGDMVEVTVEVQSPATAPEVFSSVNISHPNASAIVVTLFDPDLQARQLFAGGPDGAHLGGTTFRDGANTITGATPPYIGEFEAVDPPPAAPSTFVGEWTLVVQNGSATEAGRLNAFSINLRE